MSELIKKYVREEKEFFIISDLHFNHQNIIKYTNRPFDDVFEMNETLINNWNSTVSKNDLVLVLGDIGFGNKKALEPLIKRLNGYIVLLLGNHDRRNTMLFWNNMVDEVVKTPFQARDIIFSHEPIDCDIGTINIHGHTHGNKIETGKHIDMSVELHNYTPVKIKF